MTPADRTIVPRRSFADGSVAAAIASGDTRLAKILPEEAMSVGAQAPAGRLGTDAPAALDASDFETTDAEARAKLERVLAGEGVLVSTGQQPGLFLGPLYAIYKALTAAELAARLERSWQIPVLPLFWVASDDHDWDEVATARILDRNDQPQTLHLSPPEGRGRSAVGESPLTDQVLPLLDRLQEGLGGLAFGQEYCRMLREEYRPERTFGEAFTATLRRVLGSRPFALLDAAAAAVKRASIPIARRALEEHAASETALRTGAERLEAEGFPAAIPILPGATCLFLDRGEGRGRLYVRDGAVSEGRNGPATGLDATLDRIEVEPERFSPNVALRPVVESALMPVAATVLGPGELGYWAQLPELFRLFGTPMPILRSRFAWTIIEPKPARALEKLGARAEELADGGTAVLARRIAEERPQAVDAALTGVRDCMERAFDELDTAVAAELPGIRSAAGKARTEADKALKGFDRTVDKRVRERESVLADKAELAARNLYPDGNPQERFFTPVAYLARLGPALVDTLESLGRSQSWPGGPDVAPTDAPE